MTERFLGVVSIGEALGVSRHAVHKWRSRYPGHSSHPFPEPDVEVDGHRVLSPETLAAATAEQAGGIDTILRVPVRIATGFGLPTPTPSGTAPPPSASPATADRSASPTPPPAWPSATS